MPSAFYKAIDRLAAALDQGDLDAARRHLEAAQRLHRGPYELQSLRHWTDQLNEQEERERRKTA